MTFLLKWILNGFVSIIQVLSNPAIAKWYGQYNMRGTAQILAAWNQDKSHINKTWLDKHMQDTTASLSKYNFSYLNLLYADF